MYLKIFFDNQIEIKIIVEGVIKDKMYNCLQAKKKKIIPNIKMKLEGR